MNLHGFHSGGYITDSAGQRRRTWFHSASGITIIEPHRAWINDEFRQTLAYVNAGIRHIRMARKSSGTIQPQLANQETTCRKADR